MIRTIAFFSNYFNHHQKALCDELYLRLKEGFCFIETEPIEDFRKKMGWGQEEIPSYVLRSYESGENEERALSLARESDVVIIGTAPERYLRERLLLDRLIFRYSERPLKEGRWKIFVPYLAKKFYVNHIRNKNRSIYCLCAGAFASSDYKFLLNSYAGKCYKFGYFPFPEEKSREELSALKGQNNRIKILWCGRFLKLKRADLLIKAAALLKDEGFDFDLELVGEGEEEEKLKSMTVSLGLSDRTAFAGYLSPEETREKMEGADIYVCTSNKLEGWGSVIYEGLSAGCAVIATSKAGATPFLIKDNATGFVFRSEDYISLADKLRACLKDPVKMRDLGRSAYSLMQSEWNPKCAAERIIKVSERLIRGERFYYDEGPMSEAELIYEDWYRG
ncbi:MAG: glycosyltransferase family 4 protein [Lachnospiraceae bacterium]|nr:glycosyltransferase family 4 protein [Lachnospiraceae bacterium]